MKKRKINTENLEINIQTNNNVNSSQSNKETRKSKK